MAESAQAMQAGEIGFTHLVDMARTADAVGDAFVETKLLELARESSPGKFHYKCMHYRHSVDAKAVAKEQAELAESSFLHLNTQDDGGLFITGLLDPVGGALVRNALEPLARSSGADDYRDAPKRWADALVELAASKTRIQMQVTSSLETLLDLVGAPGAETEFSLPIASKTVERWACDSSLSRILMQDSVVIDVGRSERTIKGPRPPGSDRAGSTLPVAGLRAAGVKGRWPFRRAVVAWRRRRDREPDPALPSASLDGA